MKKLLKYGALVLFGVLWFIGCSRDTVVYLVDKGIVKDDYRYGDLYRLSNLSAFRSPLVKCDVPYTGEKQDVAVFVAGDSFTEEGRLAADELAATQFKWFFVASPDYSLDVSEKGRKILVIETVERHFRERFSERPWDMWQTPDQKPVPEKKSLPRQAWDWIVDSEVPYKEEMHESVLFGSDFFLKIKEWKADFTYKYFGRTDPAVAIVKDELVYGLDVDEGISSVYDTVSDEEIDRIVKHVNQTRENYKAKGFDEVYISVIPNKTSLLIYKEPGYNHLIERFENHPSLQAPIISVWNEFIQKNYYEKGDSHWNCEGKQMWVDKVNNELQF